MNTSSTDLTKQPDVLREQISSSLEKAQAQKHLLKRSNARYMLANILLAALATLLAATAGLLGNAKNWKFVCVLAAVCSAGATVTTKLQTTEQLTEIGECVGQLKALSVETIAPTYDLEHVSEKYQQILSSCSVMDL
jgi:hypothetical protein